MWGVDIFGSAKARAALRDLGVGLEMVAAGIPQEHEVALLFNRLGPDNREFLWRIADEFRPGDVFTLEEVATALQIPKGSVRARLMNIGRSLKSLGRHAPYLWDVSWDDGENSYEWDFDAHRAILRGVEG
jgi:hypothetical protein